jgi:hypothetical protein
VSGLNNPNPQVVPNMATIPGLMARCNNRTVGNYYGVLGANSSTSTSSPAINYIYAVPFLVLKTEAFDRISIYVNTLAIEGKARLGIYYDSNTSPGALLLDAGEVDTSTTGAKEIAINQILAPGLYWLAIIYSVTPVILACNQVINVLGFGTPSFSSNAIGNSTCYLTSQAYGELPNPHPTPAIATVSVPGIALRRA